MQVSSKYIFTHRQCCCVQFKFKTKSNNSMNPVIDRMIDKYEIVKLTYEEKHLVVEDHKRYGTAYTSGNADFQKDMYEPLETSKISSI